MRSSKGSHSKGGTAPRASRMGPPFWKAGPRFVGLLYRRRHLIAELARRDILARHQSSYLGVIWLYLQPLAFILVLVFVFEIGLRTSPSGPIPFVVFLICGMVAWQFFSTTLQALTLSIQSHAFLVKKGQVPLSLLPVAKLLSGLVPHLFLIGVSLLVCWSKGLPPTLYSLQVFYYLAAMCGLLLGLGWITSSTCLFVEDVEKIVQVLTQFGLWLTPIIWNINRVPPRYQWIVKLNPMYYIVCGYRDSLIYRIPFWSKPVLTLYFWVSTGLFWVAGRIVFRKLRSHFGEVV